MNSKGYKTFVPSSAEVAINDVKANSESVIFSAIRSSKVMVILANQADSLSDLDTANIWRRYLNMIDSGEEKEIVVAYRDMGEDEIPEELNDLPRIRISSLDFREGFISTVKDAFEAIRINKEQRIKEEQAAIISTQEEKNKALEELMGKIEELDKTDVDYTNEDHDNYDRHLEMLLKHKRRMTSPRDTSELMKSTDIYSISSMRNLLSCCRFSTDLPISKECGHF